jgi:hypothetical protein
VLASLVDVILSWVNVLAIAVLAIAADSTLFWYFGVLVLCWCDVVVPLCIISLFPVADKLAIKGKCALLFSSNTVARISVLVCALQR